MSGPFRDDSREGYDRNLGAARKPQRPNRARREQNFSEVHDPSGVRLQKLMASAGVASRRVCEDLIAEGRVEVDGKVVTETGVRVDPETSVIHVDGIRLQLDTTLRYFAFNKPRGVVSTMDDPEGRPCISDYLKKGRGTLVAECMCPVPTTVERAEYDLEVNIKDRHGDIVARGALRSLIGRASTLATSVRRVASFRSGS